MNSINRRYAGIKVFEVDDVTFGGEKGTYFQRFFSSDASNFLNICRKSEKILCYGRALKGIGGDSVEISL